ncbi:hypothetical protein M2451_002826 [Dysgonomonas sp. PFB1-18]|uniref:fasciclin domain-containing protein n=1 Tax=unclassified Dysgonomonas TaxID=2630389 RepID=UPI002473521A|nr:MULTISPECIES: fasciclin domain-containing protein [unclassified Dysgonomonas]MDH6309288.1 hypothetical protein [Dysgonomonas sp. PF1-14]MDH6339847.1 hypothetical protein [Dysgonomonas sp. PF1-16]MDH6381495.1 hypothetical protein [Dysgonomonas sp. PFB1-18]MDH6398710.1 hypothetical protein [Dysgonomonas sp. PF1-23]
MKKIFYLSIVALALGFSTLSCSDDDGPTPPPTDNTQLKAVAEALGKMDGVSGFTEVLSDNVEGINVGEGNITVFAVKDTPAEGKKAAEEVEDEAISKDNITRHIVKGTYDLTDFAADSLVIENITGKPLVITSKDGKLYINDVLMETGTPTKAGDNLIYLVDNVLPVVEMEKQTSNFLVYEINEKWAEGADEKAVSKGAVINFFRYNNEEFVQIGSVTTDEEGKAMLEHYYADSLFYTIDKEGKAPLRDDYLISGLFTTQKQIDEAPEYKTGTALDNIALGSLMIIDINVDGIIDAGDKVENGYIKVAKGEEATARVIVSETYGVETEPES